MEVYKRSVWTMVKGLILAPLAAVGLYFVVSIFTNSLLLLYGISLAAFVLLLLSALFGDNVRFELDANGILRYYKMGRLKSTHNIPQCSVGYRRKSDSGFLATHDIQLQIADPVNGNEVSIDCSGIGPGNFERMFERLQQYSGVQPGVLTASPH